jgi:hypothetical protein
MYKIENNLNFYELLNNNKKEDESNICLISHNKLDNTKTTLPCGHSFNYINIYKEVYNQKKKQPIMKYIKKNQMQCPYCRTIHDKILPFLSLDSIKRIKYVNHPSSLQYTVHKCKFKTANGLCNKQCHENGYCNRHLKYIDKEVLYNEYIEGTKSITNYKEIPVVVLKKILKKKKIKQYSKLKKNELIKLLKEST